MHEPKRKWRPVGTTVVSSRGRREKARSGAKARRACPAGVMQVSQVHASTWTPSLSPPGLMLPQGLILFHTPSVRRSIQSCCSIRCEGVRPRNRRGELDGRYGPAQSLGCRGLQGSVRVFLPLDSAPTDGPRDDVELMPHQTVVYVASWNAMSDDVELT